MVNMPVKRSSFVRLIIVVLAAGISGCADSAVEPIPVSGKVLLDGKPLDQGTIRFVPKLGRPASSTILADGSFDLATASVDKVSIGGIAPGKYRVQVSASKIIDDATIHWKAPQHYADFRTSGLEVTVAKPTTDLVIELKSDEDEVPEPAADASPDSPAQAASPEAVDS